METKDGSKQKYIEEAVVKTIAAFLNSDGGDLFVGVDDEGQIIGIEAEVNALFHQSNDKFLLAFKTSLKERIGEQFYPYIDQKIVGIKGSELLHVKCDKSPTEVFVDGVDFYVRTNPATDKLEGKKLLEYIRQRFGVTPAILS
jgi:predicted HTH transcriptional regulator